MIPSDDNEPISVSDLYGNRESLQILNSLSGQFKDSLAADKPSQFQLFIDTTQDLSLVKKPISARYLFQKNLMHDKPEHELTEI